MLKFVNLGFDIKRSLKIPWLEIVQKYELSPVTLLVIREFPYNPKPSLVRKYNLTSAVVFRAAETDAKDIPKGSQGGIKP